MLDCNHAILEIEGNQTQGSFHVAHLKIAWNRTKRGVTNSLSVVWIMDSIQTMVTNEKGEISKPIPDLSFNYTTE